MYKFFNDFTNDEFFSVNFSKTMFQKDMYKFSNEKVCTKDIFNGFQTF